MRCQLDKELSTSKPWNWKSIISHFTDTSRLARPVLRVGGDNLTQLTTKCKWKLPFAVVVKYVFAVCCQCGQGIVNVESSNSKSIISHITDTSWFGRPVLRVGGVKLTTFCKWIWQPLQMTKNHHLLTFDQKSSSFKSKFKARASFLERQEFAPNLTVYSWWSDAICTWLSNCKWKCQNILTTTVNGSLPFAVCCQINLTTNCKLDRFLKKAVEYVVKVLWQHGVFEYVFAFCEQFGVTQPIRLTTFCKCHLQLLQMGIWQPSANSICSWLSDSIRAWLLNCCSVCLPPHIHYCSVCCHTHT